MKTREKPHALAPPAVHDVVSLDSFVRAPLFSGLRSRSTDSLDRVRDHAGVGYTRLLVPRIIAGGKGFLALVAFGIVLAVATGEPVFGIVAMSIATLLIDLLGWASVLGFGRSPATLARIRSPDQKHDGPGGTMKATLLSLTVVLGTLSLVEGQATDGSRRGARVTAD